MLVQSILAVGNEIPRPGGAVFGILSPTIDTVRVQAIAGRGAVEIARMRRIGSVAMFPTPLEEGHDLGLTLVGSATIDVTLFAHSRHVQLATLDASGWIRRLGHVVAVIQAPHQEPVDEPAAALSRLVAAALGLSPFSDARRDRPRAAIEAAGELVASPMDATLGATTRTVRTVTGAFPQDVPGPAPALLEFPTGVETLC